MLEIGVTSHLVFACLVPLRVVCDAPRDQNKFLAGENLLYNKSVSVSDSDSDVTISNTSAVHSLTYNK